MERGLAQPHAHYLPGDAPDEAFTPDGDVRPIYRDLIAALQATDLRALAARASEAAAEAGLVFRTPTGEDAFVVDPVPRLIDASEWSTLDRGIAQRLRALNAFVADAYGDRAIVEAGRIPTRVIDGAVRFEPDACGIPVPSGIHIGVAGLDVLRVAGGEFQVLEDNVRTPSGASYAQGACEVVDSILPLDPPPRLSDPSRAELLLGALRAAAPHGADEPSIVLLSDGPSNSAWWEHRRLSDGIGVPIVTGDDLEVRAGRVHARLGEDGRACPVDVIYRRTDEDRLRDDRGEPTWLAEMLLEPLRAGTVACVNAFGTGIADDKLVHAYVEEMIRFYLDEEPVIRSVRTYDPGEPSVREAILERMDELVVKPRDGYGGEGVIVCVHADQDDRRAAADSIRAEPEHWVAQETVMFSTHPTLSGGELVPRHVDLRPFAYALPGAARTLPGGLTRVALDEGALVVNSSQNGGGKATWVLA